ncbi:Spy/CpxP family protein refolding chaperone [Spirosoma fluviale]|uniref:Heavy-metal resistance n=1 Tax=Spirosoma fluviale TaxID=1597977 RepID=A0A286FXT8_9BACT|nr:periplasmic heavy metal sensor [Spirosoma fluviale]SOD88060.1 Heavy-metal resistance [Spirosoma fluviale]
MERTKLLTLAVVGLLLLNLLTIGFLFLKPDHPQQPEQGPGRPGAESPAAVIIERLHMDANQQAQYRQLVQVHQAQTRTLNQKTAQLYRTYYGLLEAPTYDAQQANVLSEQIADNQRAIAQLNFDHFNQIKSLCRPDQQTDFKRLVSDLARLFGRQQRPQRPGMDGPPPGPPQDLPPRP